jgi:hypothetical protein
VRLQLHTLAYNLGNFMRTLALPKTAEPWSLTSLWEKPLKIGAKVVSHGRYITFQMAEVAVSDVCGNPVVDHQAAGTARAGMTGDRDKYNRRQRGKRRVLGSWTDIQAGWPPTEAVAIEFDCGETSSDGGSGPTGRESGECRGVTAMGGNPIIGVIFGVIAIGFAAYSLASQTETPPSGYNLLNYGLIVAGAAGIIGSLVAYAKRGKQPPSA